MYSVTLLYSVVIYEFPLNISRGHNIFPRGGRHWHDPDAARAGAPPFLAQELPLQIGDLCRPQPAAASPRLGR